MNNQAYARVRAIYHDGVLTVIDPLSLPEGSQVQVDIHLQDETTAQKESASSSRFVPAETLSGLIGLISLGGDALEDIDSLPTE